MKTQPLVLLSGVLLAVRLWAAYVVGFGDSEALYACYALHPAPMYLDHPGLVGMVARVIGEGAAPTPARAHVVTAVCATLVPWLMFAAARALGADRTRATTAALVFALVPEISVGLFALTPDLLLAPAWLGALALAALALRGKPAVLGTVSAFLGAGLLAGLAASAKASGVLLFLVLAFAYAKNARARRTIWPWAGLASGVIIVLPILSYEARNGFPMLHHRLVEPKHGVGVAITGLGGLVGGQLLYLSPILAWLAVVIARDLFRRRNEDDASTLLFGAFAIPLLPLVVLSLWNAGAEPHWIAPALLALPIHAARHGVPSPKIARYGATVAALFTLVAHAWVLVPSSARVLPDDADPKLDIANELYGWPSAVDGVREQMKLAATPSDPEGREVVVVGPHWTICAQLHAALPGIRVGCATPGTDDFDRWLPRDDWRAAADVLWVTDSRFAADGTDELPFHVRASEGHVRVFRGGRVVRVFSLYLYSRRASSQTEQVPPPALARFDLEPVAPTSQNVVLPLAQFDVEPARAAKSHPSAAMTAGAPVVGAPAMGAGASGDRPASRMSARSSSSSGFGVVSSFSP